MTRVRYQRDTSEGGELITSTKRGRRTARALGSVLCAAIGGLLLALADGAPAAADTAVVEASVPLSSIPSTQPLVLDQFAGPGTLEQVTVTVAVDGSGTVDVTNLTPTAKPTSVSLAVTASIDGPGVDALETTADNAESQSLAPNALHQFVVDTTGEQSLVIDDPAELADYIGAGTVSFDVTGVYGVDVAGPAIWRARGTATAAATVTIEFTFTDDPPTAVNDAATVVEDAAAIAIPVLANDTDPDGDPFSIASASDPANGTVVLTGGSPGAHTGVTYQPDPNYCNAGAGGTPDTFTYTLAPGGSTATVSVTVTCVPDAPVAVADAATVLEDADPSPIDVLANDVDVDPVGISVGSVTQPVNGIVVITGGGTGLTYLPDANYCNSPPGTTLDTFTYSLTPGGATATVSVTVTCVDDPPTAVDDAATLAEDAPATAVPVLANDTDVDGGPISIASASDPANGTVVITGGGTGLTYQPDANYCNSQAGGTPDTFTYTLNGGDTATVSVTVTCVDDAPTAVDDAATLAEDAPATAVPVLANDTDVDGGPISIASASDPANGTVVITGGGTGLTYQPDANYCNSQAGGTPDTFTYTLNGGDTATVSVTVTCVDDAPTAVDDAATLAEDAPATAVPVLANDTDVDGGPISIASASDPANGTVVITGGGTGLTYQPDANYCNSQAGGTPDTFTYTLNGGDTATVSVTVTCVDDAPTAVDDAATLAEDAPATAVPVLANDTDVDGGPISIASASDPANGTVVITGGGTGLTYQPDANYCNSQAGGTPDTFTYTLNGGDTATVSVTVTCVDDAPTAVDDAATLAEDAPATAVPVLANDTDVDGGPISIASASDPANGTVVITGGGTGLTYQPDANYCNSQAGGTPDTFTYTLNGGDTATVSVTVTCVPDDPTAVADNATVVEDAAATAIGVLANDLNPDQTLMTIASVTQPVSGTVVVTGGGTGLTYQPNPNYCNTPPGTALDSFTYALAPGGSTATVTVTVTCVDDPPVAVADAATVTEDAAATAVDVLANDTDVDAGPKTVASVTQPINGTVVITGGGTGLTYLPNANYCNSPPSTTPDTFTYALNPGGSTATVSVTVICVNDPPVADDETFDAANSAVGNTALVVNDPDDAAPTVTGPRKSIAGDILAGDTDVDGPGPLVVTAGTFASNDGGSVILEADGDFTFLPAAGTSCTDTSDFFDYTVSDQNSPTAATDAGRVTIAITNCVWYVSNNAPGNSGTSTAPFDTLAQADTATPAGDTIFVFDGNNTSTGYTTGVDLVANQRLIGEAADLVVAGAILHTGIPANQPTITDNNADVVVLDDANTVTGLNINPQGTGGGIAGGAGDVGGTIAGVDIADTATFGTEPGLELDATSGTWNISSFTVSTNGATGIRLNNAGTVNFADAGAITISTAGAKGLDAAGATTSFGPNSVIDRITVTGSGIGAVSLAATTGTIDLGDGTNDDLVLNTTSGPTAALFSTHTGALTVGNAGVDNISATGGPAIDVTGPAALAFDDVDSTNSATDGINLDGLGTQTFSAASGDITGAAGIAFDLNAGSGNVTYPGNLNNGTGATAEITGRTGGTVTLSGAIADTNDAGGGITLTGNTAGSTTFSNASKVLNTGASAAVTLSSNAGHTIAFTGGGFDIDTTSGSGFAATGGGTVSVQGSGNTVDTGTGTALNVTNTTIAATGLSFRAISANGATNGIVLDSSGTTGFLSVTGNGSTTQGGDNSGGTIQNTTGHGISLTNTTSPSFRNVRLLNTGNSGVNGTQVSGFTFTDSTISGAGDASDENSITFDDSLTSAPNLTGAVTITNNVISQTEAEGIDIENWAGTISDANISNNALSDTGDVATPGSAVTLIGSGLPASAANITRATVANNTITDFRAGVGVQVRAGNPNAGAPTGSAGTAGSATNVIAVTGNSMNGGNGGIGNQPDRFFTGGVSGNGGQGNFNISNNGTATNRIRSIDCIAIEVQMDGPVTMTSTVQNNFINPNSAVGCAGIAVGTDDPNDLGAGTHSTLISGNNVMGTDGPGIFPIVRDSGSTMIARVLNNTVAAPITTNAARAGIRVDSGSAQGDTTMCLEISGNTTAGSTNSATATTSPGINLRKQGTDPAINTFGIEGLAATGSPGVENHVNGLNTSTSGTFGVGGTALLSAQSGFTSCVAP